jgi:hypothetical protein
MWLPSKEVVKRLDSMTSNAAHPSWSLIRQEVMLGAEAFVHGAIQFYLNFLCILR